MTTATLTRRQTYQAISVAQRRAVIDKIVNLTAITARGKNEQRGCCWNGICLAHIVTYRLAVLRLTNYAVRGAR